MSTPQISVIVPFFNSEPYLAACIESLLSQDFEAPYEVLLVNNNSTDGSGAIAERYRGRLHLLEESVPGAYAARNTGLRQAQAPVIAFTDADCVADPGWLRAIHKGMEDPGVAILLGHCRYPDEASSMLRLLGAYENAKTAYVLGHCARAHHFGYTNNMAFRAAVFEELGPFREWKRAADSEMVHRLAAARPDLRPAFCPAMGMTHLEFLSARDRTRRLSLYTQTNSKIESFQELSLRQRLGVLRHLLLRRSGI